MMHAVIYTYAAVPNNLSRDRQKAACVDAAEAAGYEITTWLHDEAGDRSGLNLLCWHLHDRWFDSFVVRDQSRFGRFFNAFQKVIETVKSVGVHLVFCNEPTPPVSFPAARSEITSGRTSIANIR